jgi:hypothetical protein
MVNISNWEQGIKKKKKEYGSLQDHKGGTVFYCFGYRYYCHNPKSSSKVYQVAVASMR